MRLPKLPGFKRPLASQKKVSVLNIKSLEENNDVLNESFVSVDSLLDAGFDLS